MTDNSELICPTIDVFVYDLAEGLGQNQEEIIKNRHNFWQKIYPEIPQDDSKKLLLAETSDYIELLSPKHQKFEEPYDGYYYPVKMGDTYALQIDCSGENPPPDLTSKPQSIEVLEKIDKIVIEKKPKSSTIGESWLIWGKLAASDQDVDKVAEACYKKLSLFSDFEWEQNLKGKGEFWGAKFYEFWRLPSDRGKLEQNRHLVICLFQQDTDIQRIETLFTNFIQLFRYRNKIIWAYHQSRELKSKIKRSAQLIQTIVKNLQETTDKKIDIKKLQKSQQSILTILASYDNLFAGFQVHQQTINSNLNNYQKRLQAIAKLDPENRDRLLDCFEPFASHATEKYQQQLAEDSASLSPTLRLLENTITTIQGIIELEQTKSDRALSETVAIATVGLGLSAITATVVTAQKPPKADTLFVFTPPFLLSIGVFFLCLIPLIFRLWRR